MNVCAVGKKDKCWLPFNRRNERYNIDGGNIYLADSRAENLKHYLEQYLTKKYKAKVTVTIKDVQTSTTKYASAVITGIVFKTPEATTNFYIEDFGQKRGDNFYIGASPSKIWGKNKLNSKNDFSLEKAQQFCEQQGFKGLTLETAIDNPAQKLYEKLGWEKDYHCFHYFWQVKR